MSAAIGSPLQTGAQNGAQGILRRVWHHRSGRIGLSILGSIVVLAVIGDWIRPYDPLEVNIPARLQAPSWSHWFGTDELGRDLLSRVIAGTRLFLLICCVATTIATCGGLVLGLLAVSGGRVVDMLIMRLVDLMLSFPYVLLVLAIVSVLGPSLVTAMVAVGIAAIPGYARLVRGEALSVREREYVLAMQVLGAGRARITFGTILPNVMSPLVVYATYALPLAVLSAAALSFLGLGARPPLPEWGAMLVQSRSFLRSAWWVVAAPGLSIFIAILGMNLLGNAVRDVLDAHTR